MSTQRMRILAGALMGVTGGAVTGLIGGLAAIPILGISDQELGTTYGSELLKRWIPLTAALGLLAGALVAGRLWRRQ